MSTHRNDRRRFLGYASLAVLAPLAGQQAFARPAAAAAATLPKLPESDPMAQAMAYVEKAEASKHAAYKPGSDCANCMLYAGAKGEKYGPCQVFPQHSVAAAGWCSAWVAKP